MKTELPPGYMFRGKPFFRKGEDCMGRPYSEWEQSVQTPLKKVIMAVGESEQEVTKKLIRNCWAEHDFRNLPDGERLDKILAEAQKRGRFYDAELVDVIAILARRQPIIVHA